MYDALGLYGALIYASLLAVVGEGEQSSVVAYHGKGVCPAVDEYRLTTTMMMMNQILNIFKKLW